MAPREQSPQQRGRDFEVQESTRPGLEQIERSGAGLYKLDVSGLDLILELKHTDQASFRVDEKLLRRLDDATTGPAGAGVRLKILVVKLGELDRTVAVIDWPDAIGMLKGEHQGAVQSTKDEQRRADVELPSILRD